MATSASGGGGKKPWRYYYVMAFPYRSAIPREKVHTTLGFVLLEPCKFIRAL